MQLISFCDASKVCLTGQDTLIYQKNKYQSKIYKTIFTPDSGNGKVFTPPGENLCCCRTCQFRRWHLTEKIKSQPQHTPSVSDRNQGIITVTFTEFLSRATQYQRVMKISRRLSPETAIEPDLPRG